MTPEERAHPPTTEEMATAIAYCNRVLGSDWRNQSAFAIAAAIRTARQEEREAYAAIFDYAVNSQAAHHSEVCDCGLCRAIAAIRARAQESER